MGISMVRKPSVNYFVEEATNYYAEDDVYLSNSLGVTKQKYSASLENIIYGKINIDNITYLVSIKDMKIPENENISNYNSISNVDDIIPFRYAYGNQNGYVIGRGAEVSHTVNGNQFTVNSGRLVIQGVESDINANGVTLTIDSVSETRYYVVYYEINLATNTANIKLSNFDTAGYPTINTGDDLTSNSNGIARLPLYRFTTTSGVISGVEKVVKAIEYSGTALVGYDISKGTVEERLTALGFKEGSIVFNENFTTLGLKETSVNSITRQGNYCIAKVIISSSDATSFLRSITMGSQSQIIGQVSEEFIPKVYQSAYSVIGSVRFRYSVSSMNLNVVVNGVSIPVVLQITNTGLVYLNSVRPIELTSIGIETIYGSGSVEFTFGYEAKPL